MTDEEGMFMRVRWFGSPWGGVINDENQRVGVPVGTRCMECTAAITERDRGIVTACSARIFGSWELHEGEFLYRVCSYHLRCWMKVVVGEEITGEVLARMQGATTRSYTGDEIEEIDEPVTLEDDTDVVPGRGWGTN